MRDPHAVVFHRLAFTFVGMDAVRHDGFVVEQAVFRIAFPVLGAVGVQFPHPRDFRRVFGQVRLHGQIAFRRQFS